MRENYGHCVKADIADMCLIRQKKRKNIKEQRPGFTSGEPVVSCGGGGGGFSFSISVVQD